MGGSTRQWHLRASSSCNDLAPETHDSRLSRLTPQDAAGLGCKKHTADSLTIEPSRKYLTKAYVVIGIVGGAIVLLAVVIAALVTLGPEVGVEAIGWDQGISLAVDVVRGVPAILMTGLYFRSLRYQIHKEQVIMHVGVVTRSVKYVPFRTVTNMTVQRDPLDRAFGIGSLENQTAGISGTT